MMAGLGTEISPIVLDSSSCSSGSCDDSTESDHDSSLEYLGSVQGALPEFRPELKPTIFLGDDECMIVRIKPSPFAPRISSDHPLVWRNKRQRRKLENKRAAPAPSNAATSTSTSRHQAWQQQTIGLSHDGSRSIRISPPSTLSRKRRKSSGQSGMRSLDSYFSPARRTKVPTPNLISARSQKQPLSMSTFHRKEPPTSRHASRVTPFHNGLTGDGNEGEEEQDEETISIGVARAQPQAYDSSDAEADDDDDDDYAPSRVTRRNRVPSRKVREQPLPRPMARRKRIQSPGESSNSYEQHMQKRIAEGSDTGSELEAQMTRTSLDCLNMDNAEGGFGFASFDDDRKPAAKRPVRSHNHEQAPSKPDDLTLEEIIARSKKKAKGRQRKSGRLMEKDAGAIQLECPEERSKRSTLFDEFETLQMATIGLDTFLQYWRMAEVEMGVETEVVEKAKFFTKANQSVQNSTDQKKAQYGRFLPFATHKMFGMVNLNKDDIFIDIGSGIGNTCLQASYTVGCDSRGIELVKDRHAIADIYRKNLNTLNGGEVGKVELVLGELQAEENRDFITGGGRRTVKAFCNNYNAVFSHRSTKTTQQLYTLDHYIAGLFSIMAEGSVLLTLHPLDIGPGSRARVNEERKKRGLPYDHNASFFEETRVELGPECNTVSWSKNEKPLIGYIYERVGEPKFLCFNPRCSNARSYSNASQIVDIKNKHTTLRRLVPIPGCPECKASNRPKRQRKQRDYFE